MPKLPSIAFVNASPLIILAKSGHLELLRVAGNQVCVPKTVHQEVCTGSSDSVTRHAVENASWLEVVEVPNIPASVLAWDLGPGESSVIACAKKVPGSESVIDDLAGRRCAAALSIPVRGSIAIVLLAKRLGLINSARIVLEDMLDNGMYLSPSLLNEALKMVGEQ